MSSRPQEQRSSHQRDPAKHEDEHKNHLGDVIVGTIANVSRTKLAQGQPDPTVAPAIKSMARPMLRADSPVRG